MTSKAGRRSRAGGSKGAKKQFYGDLEPAARYFGVIFVQSVGADGE